MPPLLPIKLLEEAWEHRALIAFTALIGLMALAKRQQETIGALRAELAMKPRVEVREVTRTVVKRVEGPVRVQEKIILQPGGERIIERVVDRGPVTTDSGSEVAQDRKESQPVLPARPRNRILGIGASPYDPRLASSVRAGYALGYFDISAAYHFYGPQELRPRIELGFRF